MSANNYDRHESAGRLSDFLNPQHPDDMHAALSRIEAKVDALHTALVKPQSIIILAGDDIARIAAELERSKE